MSSAFSENRLLFARMATGLILDCGCGEGLYKDVLERGGRPLVSMLRKNIWLNRRIRINLFVQLLICRSKMGFSILYGHVR